MCTYIYIYIYIYYVTPRLREDPQRPAEWSDRRARSESDRLGHGALHLALRGSGALHRRLHLDATRRDALEMGGEGVGGRKTRKAVGGGGA